MLFLMVTLRSINWSKSIACTLYFSWLCYFSIWALVIFTKCCEYSSNIGLLPTKRLMPLWTSYGGSSMLVNCFMLGVILRLTAEMNVGGAQR